MVPVGANVIVVAPRSLPEPLSKPAVVNAGLIVETTRPAPSKSPDGVKLTLAAPGECA